jgi:hypothetical protein
MEITSNYNTIIKNYLDKYLFLVEEYELAKTKSSTQFKYLKDFYQTHKLNRKTFLKFYNRYKESNNKQALLPQKRGPKYKTRRPLPLIEKNVIELREKGMNRYEIVNILKPKLKQFTPKPSGVYNICKRHNLNRLNKTMKINKRRIIKERIGELGHIDLHYLNNNVIKGNKTQYYILGLIDDCSRIVCLDLIDNYKSLTVMFSALKCINILNDHYQIKFEEILSDNGVEFGKKNLVNKESHPFERLLIELGIKHRYTKVYRPQTNGKIERFWRTLEEDMLEDAEYDTVDALKEELLQYSYYYNHERPHQGINGQTPHELLEKMLPK